MYNTTSSYGKQMYPAAAYYLGGAPVAAYSGAHSAGRRAPLGSNSLASMLPSLLMTGLITLVMAAVLRLVWVGFSADFYAAWMEAWLTSWPIVFPFAYLLSAPVFRLAALVAAPAVTLEAGRAASLSLAQIADASANATAINGLRAQRRRAQACLTHKR
ncbi:MAG: DUF2798 domain-containing protein [Oxalobacteraceae bacterium]|nr:DUF2798 domain-containing protein [Oxalobacteraceae bacterium]